MSLKEAFGQKNVQQTFCLSVLATCIGQHSFNKTHFWLLVDVIKLENSYVNRYENCMHLTRRTLVCINTRKLVMKRHDG